MCLGSEIEVTDKCEIIRFSSFKISVWLTDVINDGYMQDHPVLRGNQINMSHKAMFI